ALGPELSAVERSKQASAADLPCDGGQRVLGARRSASGILCRISYATAGATIGVTHQHAPELVHRNVIEVEQVAAWVAAALIPYTAALHRVRRSRVDRGPSTAAVIREGDIEVPNAREIG